MKYAIETCYISTLEWKLDKLNKKARKLGFEECSFTTSNERVIDTVDGVMELVDVELVGNIEDVVLNGWKFAGTLEAFDESNMVKSFSGFSIPSRYTKMVNVCEHCGTKRKRKMTYVVYNADEDKYMAVGKSCLKDFINSESAVAVAQLCESMNSLLRDLDGGCGEWDEEYPKRVRRSEFVNTELVLAFTIAEMRVNGWVSVKSGYELCRTSTKEMVLRRVADQGKFMEYVAKNYAAEQRMQYDVTDADFEKARRIIEWMKGLSGNEYKNNLAIIANYAEVVNLKNVGYVCSAVSAHYNMVEKYRVSEDNNSEYIGTVGKKIEEDVELVDITPIYSDWGTTLLHTFIRDGKDIVKWFCSGKMRMEVGNAYTIKGTVKAHNVYASK
jgi:hypothetical protein